LDKEHERSDRPLPRDHGGSIELTEGTGGIRTMVACDRFLEIYKVDVTFRLETPETVDPDRTNPNAPVVAVVADRVGTSSPIIARVLLQGRDLVDTALFAEPIDKVAIVRALHGIKEALLACQKAADCVSVAVSHAETEWAATPREDRVSKRVIASLPQVPDLALYATQFLISATRAIKGICSLAPEFLALERADSNFDHLGDRVEKLLGADSPLTQFLRRYADVSRYLIELRNFQEHPVLGKATIIDNIRVKPDGSVAVPLWFITGSTPRPIHTEMLEAIERLIEMAELTLIHLVGERLDPRWPFILQEFSVAEVDAAEPVRYRLSIDISKMGLPQEETTDASPSSPS
jgi:hypothetical protein